jgi:hypothetical protein
MCFSRKEGAKIGHWGDFVIFFGFQQHFFSTSIKNVDHLSQWIGQKTYAPLIHLSLFKYPSNLHDFLFSPFEIYKKWPQLTKNFSIFGWTKREWTETSNLGTSKKWSEKLGRSKNSFLKNVSSFFIRSLCPLKITWKSVFNLSSLFQFHFNIIEFCVIVYFGAKMPTEYKCIFQCTNA